MEQEKSDADTLRDMLFPLINVDSKLMTKTQSLILEFEELDRKYACEIDHVHQDVLHEQLQRIFIEILTNIDTLKAKKQEQEKEKQGERKKEEEKLWREWNKYKNDPSILLSAA